MDGALVTAPSLDLAIKKLRGVRDLQSLTEYLRDELEWPIADWDIEDLTFEYTAEDAGLDPQSAVKVRSIRRLRPIVADQPWGIFFIDFHPGDLPITVLRRILRTMVLKKRTSARSDRQAWQMDDLLFISVLGENSERDLNLAHFNEDPTTKRATLRVVEWDEADTHFHMLRTSQELRQLSWRSPGESIEDWRRRWASAFALKHGEVPDTAKKLASEMARLAKLIRARVNAAMDVKSQRGPLRRLHSAFREVLLHDLDQDGFADMYAQTLTYGLFAARRSRPMGITAENARDMVPSTNPFLRDLLAQFTDISGLTESLDFDELGIDALVEMLNRANIDAVVEDFGRAKPGEDPVIHFYEDFLTEYNRKQKIQRGIFYTPRPVVSFIVRSVHELLQSEFGLEDGLASTATWEDMLIKFPGMNLPDGATTATPFIQILDPAVGTGTFLVEVIDVIHRTMTDKWHKQGHRPLEILSLWNDYVPNHLLPRLYGFELMMAPYAICHMKIALKLAETDYRFLASERLRIYLTNALEPAQDFSGQFDIMAPALAHEARAVNEVKRHVPFTVVLGNPPYSNFGQLNKIPFILELLEDYKRGLDEKKINLDDDFIKFIRFGEYQVQKAGVGCLSFITNSSFLDGLTHRQMRYHLHGCFDNISLLNLHGSTQRGERSPSGQIDENVFDIKQGVAISIFTAGGASKVANIKYTDSWGSRLEKYERLLGTTIQLGEWSEITPQPHGFFFTPKEFAHAAEYEAGISLPDAFHVFQNGIKTDRDDLFFGYTQVEVDQRMREFFSDNGIASPFRETYRVENSSSYKLLERRRKLKFSTTAVQPCLYRPFDTRWLYYEVGLTSRPAFEVMQHMLKGDNLALLTCRQQAELGFQHIFVARLISECCSVSLKTREITSVFPLHISPKEAGWSLEEKSSNLTPLVYDVLREKLGDRHGLTPDDILAYAYAVFHSPIYRSRYAEFLKIDFPRLPITSNLQLFHSMVRLGKELVDLHLVEAPEQQSLSARYDKAARTWRCELAKGQPLPLAFSFEGPETPIIGNIGWSDNTVWIDTLRPSKDAKVREGGIGFRGVPEHVWNFHIGGYQVCEKWLKDRKGRTLTAEDIAHYHRIVIALHETIRIMREIDEAIESHGGWPAAFQTS